MVFYFYPRGWTEGSDDWIIYMGKDKFENEDLIKYGYNSDVWFHVDDLSSAHVYLRLPDGVSITDIPADTLEDCAQLVKQNSIQGCKLNNVPIVYTPWNNLKKTQSMEVGQVGFHNEKLVYRCKVEKKNGDIIKRLEKSQQEKYPDLAAEKEAYEKQLRDKRKAEERRQRAAEKAAKEENKRQQELKSYKTLMKEENMVSNKDIQDKYKDFADYEDDFM